MSLVMLDSFAHYSDVTAMSCKWHQVNSVTPGVPGRYTSGIAMPNSDSYCWVNVAAQSGFTVGFYYKWSGSATAIYQCGAAFLGTSGIPAICGIGATSAGQLTLYSVAGQSAATSLMTPPLTAGQWTLLECQFTLGSAGDGTMNVTATLKQGGAVLLSSSYGTGLLVAKRLSGMADANIHSLSNTGGGTTYFSDFYLVNNLGTVNNSFLGATAGRTYGFQVGPLWAIADVTGEQWTPLSGSSHYAMINAHAPLYDASYIESSTTGQVDQFSMQAPGAGVGAIRGLQVVCLARQDDSGTRKIVAVINSAAQTLTQTGYQSSTYEYALTPSDQMSAGVPWTAANIASSTFGVKVA